MSGMLSIWRQFVRDIARRVRDMHREHPMRTWLVLGAFIASFGYALLYRIPPSVDARKFHEIAVNLATKNTFCFQCTVPLEKDTAIRDIGPGYQFFLAGIYKVFGVRLWVVWLIQALMHATIVWWLYGLVRRLLGDRPSTAWNTTIPLGLYAFHIDVVQNTAMLMSDNLFMFLLLAQIKFFLYLWDNRAQVSPIVMANIGMLAGLLMLVRPTGLPFLVIGLVVFLAKRWWKVAGIVLACAVLIQAPWALRNYRLYNHFILNSVVGGLDIWVGLDPYSPGEFNLDALPHITKKIEGLGPEQVDRVAMEEVKNIIQEKPAFAIGRTIHKGLKLFALTKTSAFWFHYRSIADQLLTLVLSISFNLAVWLAAFACLIEVLWRRKWPPILVSVCIVSVVLLAAAPTLAVVVNRYRIPMLPFAVLLVSYWFIMTSSWRERYRSLVVAGVILAACTLADLWNSFPKVLERISRIRH